MTPRPETAPAAGIATTFALRAQAVATPAAEAIRPANQATFKLTTTDEKWGQIRPSRWGQRKSSFSIRCRMPECPRSVLRSNGGW